VSAVSGIGMKPFDRIADELLDRRNDAGQRMPVLGIARQHLYMGLPCLRVVATPTLTPNS
jgi:hypothetical protein